MKSVDYLLLGSVIGILFNGRLQMNFIHILCASRVIRQAWAAKLLIEVTEDEIQSPSRQVELYKNEAKACLIAFGDDKSGELNKEMAP